MKIHDLLLLLLLLLVAGGAYLFISPADNQTAGQIHISVDGKPYGSYSLKEDRTITVKTAHGSNTVQIRKQQVFMLQADCPNQVCLKESPVSKAGQTLVCVPHKLLITTSSSAASTIDAVAR